MKTMWQLYSSHFRIFALHLLAALALSTQLGGGCVSTPSEDDRSNDRYNDRYDSKSDNRYEEDKNRIPSNARLVKEGRGEIGFRAGSNGRAYVLNERDREVVYTEDLLDGDTFAVLPDDNRIRVNSRERKVELKRDDVHRIYFDGRRNSYNDRDTYDRPNDNRPQDKPNPAVKRPVPDTAKLMAETSRGGELSFKAAGNGKAYLYDNGNNTLVQTFTVKKGQRLTINVSTGLGSIDGKQVFKQSLSQKATYRLLFEE